jgi:hypothetical protein
MIMIVVFKCLPSFSNVASIWYDALCDVRSCSCIAIGMHTSIGSSSVHLMSTMLEACGSAKAIGVGGGVRCWSCSLGSYRGKRITSMNWMRKIWTIISFSVYFPVPSSRCTSNPRWIQYRVTCDHQRQHGVLHLSITVSAAVTEWPAH